MSSPDARLLSESQVQAEPKTNSWLAATLPVAFISALAELALGILNNSALPVYIKHGLDLEPIVFANVMVPFFFAEVLFKSPLGILADRWGRKPLMVLGPAISIFTPLVWVFTNYPPGQIRPELLALFGFLRLLDGLGAAALWPAMFAYVGDHVRAEKRTSAMSLLNVTYMLGLAFGFLAGGWANDTFGPVLSGEATMHEQLVKVYHSIGATLHHHHKHHLPMAINLHPSGVSMPITIDRPVHYHPSFYLASILFALATSVAILAIKSSKPVQSANLGEKHEKQEEMTWGSFLSAIKSVPNLMLIAFVTFMGIGCIALLVKLFAIDELGVTETDFGLLVLWPAIIIGGLAIPLGHISDRFGKVRSVRAGFILATLGMWIIVGLFTAPSIRDIALMVGGSLLGIGFVISFPAWMALLTTMCTDSHRGTVVGAVSTAQGIGMLMGAELGSWLYSHASANEHTAHIAPFAASALLLTISSVMTLLMIRSDSRVVASPC